MTWAIASILMSLGAIAFASYALYRVRKAEAWENIARAARVAPCLEDMPRKWADDSTTTAILGLFNALAVDGYYAPEEIAELFDSESLLQAGKYSEGIWAASMDELERRGEIETIEGSDEESKPQPSVAVDEPNGIRVSVCNGHVRIEGLPQLMELRAPSGGAARLMDIRRIREHARELYEKVNSIDPTKGRSPVSNQTFQISIWTLDDVRQFLEPWL